ncbi:hypothetical protein [Microbacterium capsulatum]|uniref:Uncharacterized protein n=1 Tax=Microbacterium capsulatum TaxID=3041921 RepID=A0ABU0XMP2_9MICO|nr:hypothetical protein [Microbacterium sp. ASV81]MDQ4215868.1 hypothetical protein [Microbacterium sp. ASV81]
MILAGFVLLSIGLADILRRFLRGAAFWIGVAIAALLLLVVGVLGAACTYAAIGIVLAVLWAWLFPLDGQPRLSFWPAVLLAVLVAASVAIMPARASTGLFDGRWLATPVGPVGFDLLVLGVGVFAALLETGNVIVRAALTEEEASLPADVVPAEIAMVQPPVILGPGTPTAPTPSSHVPVADPGFRGGRLIGPLERVLVLLLTLVAAYALLAAMLAAKGIVRFPEISRDGASGARAEYFLVGSLVSWVVALGGAMLLWWATRAA